MSIYRSPQVLVVGAGPVGLTMAIELSRYGVAVRIVDELPQPSDKSRALAVWSRTLELLDRSEASPALIAAGNRVDATNFFAGSERLGQITFGGVVSPYPFALLIPQNETERVLRERLSLSGVEVERGVELTHLDATAGAVTARLSHADGSEETLETQWLIGCDGAHSAVRHLLGKEFAGNTVATDFVLADVHISGIPTPPSQMDMFTHSDGILALFPIAPGRYRVIADIGPAGAANPAEPTLADVGAIVEARGPGGARVYDPIWISAFRVNERQVADYRSERIFLAGDAAHVHSPAGGQGMNLGMQDAFNLAWKLALVARGICGPEPLLESYSAERSPIARQVIFESGRLTAMMTLRNPAWQSIRNHLARLMLGLSPVRDALAQTLSEVSLGYPDSPLTQTRSHAHGGPKAGERAPLRPGDAPAGAGTQPRFALSAAASERARTILAHYPELLEPAVRAPFHDGGMWLIRPDGYIGAAAPKDAWTEVSAYLDSLAPGARYADVPSGAT